MALPRVGMGVGGLLLGTWHEDVLRLDGSIEIPCSHAGGPSFNLTEDEKEALGALIAGAGEGVIGWYCSKTRGDAALGNAEMAIYREFFSKPGQIALMLRPSAAEPTRAAFFFRDGEGNAVKGIECDVDEWRPDEAESEPAVEEHMAAVRPEAIERVVSPVNGPITQAAPIATNDATDSPAPPAPRRTPPSPPVKRIGHVQVHA